MREAEQLVFHFLASSLHFESALKSIFLLLFFQVEFLLVGAALLTYLSAGDGVRLIFSIKLFLATVLLRASPKPGASLVVCVLSRTISCLVARLFW